MGDLKFLDYINLGYIWLKNYPDLLRVWSTAGSSKTIRVNYGYQRIAAADEFVFGGLVKLQDLNQFFPQSRQQPNILYLVSSALPYFPRRLVRMAQKQGAKIVLNQNGVAYPGWYGKGYEKANKAMAYVHAVADYVFYQSEFCKVSAEKFLGRRPVADSCEILYNPVNTEVFKPLQERQRAGIVLLLAGSHWTTYRVFAAIETLQLLTQQRDDVVLRIAGRFCWQEDGQKALQEVMEYAKKLEVDEMVEYTGPYSQKEAPQLMQSSSILLHTKYNDPCPRLVVEAMACGLPVVYSASGGVGELVGDKAGIGVPAPLNWQQDHPPGANELAGSVFCLLEDLSGYSVAARKRAVRNFQVEDWIGRHQTVFTSLLGEHR